MEIKFLGDKSDISSVMYSYLFLLGREPESLGTLEYYANMGMTISELRESSLKSEEFRRNFIFYHAEAMFRANLNNIPSLTYENNCTSDDIIMLQTSDAYNYSEILDVTSSFNKKYCQTRSLKYQNYQGIKYGYHSHHATYNRIFLIWDIISSGYRGWIFYIDADAFVSDPDWEIEKFLTSARSEEKTIVVHSVHEQSHPKYDWWNINAGAFIIDCSANHSRILIDLWKNFYTKLYSHEDLKRATSWHDIVDDQSSLWFIMRLLNKSIPYRDEVLLTRFQFDKIYQALRKDAMRADTSQELKERINDVREQGLKIWKHM